MVWNLIPHFFLFLANLQLLYSYIGAISKYVIRKHLCGVIIQWWFSYIYCALCCAFVYSASSLSGALSQRDIAVLVCV
jgi:hypothetical protein